MARTQIDSSLVPSAAVSSQNLPNILDNGGFEIWQRGNSFSTPASLTYLADRWSTYNTSAANVTVTKEATIVDTGLASIKVAVTSTSANEWQVYQQIENFTDYRGKTVTFSARCNASVANAIRIRIFDGTTQTFSSYHTGGSTWQTLTVTATIGASASLIHLGIGMFGSDKTSGTYYFDSAMLTIGSSVVTFVPTNPQQDLARCQRYYETGNTNTTSYGGYDGTSYILQMYATFKVTKMVSPTISVSNLTVNEDGSTTNVQANYSHSQGPQVARVNLYASKAAGGQRPYVYEVSWTASADL